MTPPNKEQLLQSYRNHLIIGGTTQTTQKYYMDEAIRLFECLPDLTIENETVYSYLKQFSHLAASSQNKTRSALRKLLKFLGKNSVSSAKSIIIPDIKHRRTLPEILSEDEILSRLKVCKNLAGWLDWKYKRDYALALLLYATGLRISEALRMQLRDIEGEWLRVENGKGSKDRYVPIAQESVEAIKSYLQSSPFKHDNALFVTNTGKSMTKSEAYKTIKDALGISPHTVRHCFATHLVLNSCDISIVSDFLGHSDISTTQIYTHVQKPHLKETVLKCHPMEKGYTHAS